MNLLQTVALHSGGEGSGCHGENCGRPKGHAGEHSRQPTVIYNDEPDKNGEAAKYFQKAGTSLAEITKGFSITSENYHTNLKVVVRNDNVDGVRSHIIIDGEIIDNDGNNQGNFARRINMLTMRVSHDFFFLDSSAQGKGIATDLNENSFKLYEKMGMKSVNTVANGAVGKYAWAVQGFDFQLPEELDRAKEELKTYLREDSYRKGRALLTVEVDKVIDGLKHSWDVARFQLNGEKAGKESMLAGQEWQGILHLGASDGRAVFDTYASKAKGKKK